MIPEQLIQNVRALLRPFYSGSFATESELLQEYFDKHPPLWHFGNPFPFICPQKCHVIADGPLQLCTLPDPEEVEFWSGEGAAETERLADAGLMTFFMDAGGACYVIDPLDPAGMVYRVDRGGLYSSRPLSEEMLPIHPLPDFYPWVVSGANLSDLAEPSSDQLKAMQRYE